LSTTRTHENEATLEIERLIAAPARSPVCVLSLLVAYYVVVSAKEKRRDVYVAWVFAHRLHHLIEYLTAVVKAPGESSIWKFLISCTNLKFIT
jgi:hypothetical protein